MDNTSIITQVANPKDEESISSSQDKGKEMAHAAHCWIVVFFYYAYFFFFYCCCYSENGFYLRRGVVKSAAH